MGSYYYCSICGVKLGKSPMSHRCSRQAIERLDRGRESWKDDLYSGRVRGETFSTKLKDAQRMLFPDGDE